MVTAVKLITVDGSVKCSFTKIVTVRGEGMKKLAMLLLNFPPSSYVFPTAPYTCVQLYWTSSVSTSSCSSIFRSVYYCLTLLSSDLYYKSSSAVFRSVYYHLILLSLNQQSIILSCHYHHLMLCIDQYSIISQTKSLELSAH